MKTSWPGNVVFSLIVAGLVSCVTTRHDAPPPRSEVTSTASYQGAPVAQVPSWSADDLRFFMHGSISTEFAPEPVLRAFIKIYPDLFPNDDLSNLGLIPDPDFGWPIGFSRGFPSHLGGLSAVGVNCASCHYNQVVDASSNRTVSIIGGTSHFDAEAFFGAVVVATFRTAETENMKRFLAAYLDAGEASRAKLATQLDEQSSRIAAAIAEDPTGARGAGPGGLHPIESSSLRFTRDQIDAGIDLAELSRTMLKLFHNMRAALHVTDQPPEKLPPSSGPGRNDAFGLLSLVLFQSPQPYAPVKYGLLWNLDRRKYVHWDGNTRSPIGRNVLAAQGLGAPLIGTRGQLDMSLIQRRTDLSEVIRAPKYPFAIDRARAERGIVHFKAHCATCHGGDESDARLYAIDEIGTDPNRARSFDSAQAAKFNNFFAKLEAPGYRPPSAPAIRSTHKYWAATLTGVWARSPYLHNGSVRTMTDLLMPPAQRPKHFSRGTNLFDSTNLGYLDEGAYGFDTTTPGNSNGGHDYGTGLTDEQKRELIEYLKTL